MTTGSETLLPGGFDDAGDGAREQPPAPPARGRRWRRRILAALLVLTVVFLLVAATASVVGYGLYKHYDGNITRVPDVFDEAVLPETARPPQAVPGTEDVLLVGSDSRDGATTGSAATAAERPGAQRADTIMLVHLTADGRAAWVVSFPRDSWVTIPGRGQAKLNAAYSYGGPALLIATIERMTKVRVDHFVAVDFTGFKAMTDAVGGVEVAIDETVTDPRSGRTWRAGVEELDGDSALDFVRQRYGLPRGDLDRIERQQQFLLALKDRATDRGMLTRPLALNRLLDAATRSLSVDDRLTAGRMRAFVRRLRHVQDEDVHFVTVPVSTIAARRGTQSVVLLDDARARTLYTALRDDRLASWGG